MKRATITYVTNCWKCHRVKVCTQVQLLFFRDYWLTRPVCSECLNAF